MATREEGSTLGHFKNTAKVDPDVVGSMPKDQASQLQSDVAQERAEEPTHGVAAGSKAAKAQALADAQEAAQHVAETGKRPMKEDYTMQ